jgi:mannitol-1-phosphate/altronate dehydrogenase
LRQVVLVDQITDIQLIKNRLWNGVHAMLAWYASLMGYESIGVAMGDHSVKAFAENLIAEVKQGLQLYYLTMQKIWIECTKFSRLM